MRAILALLACLAGPAQAMKCEVRSGPQTAALVELYTSEGCSSCPPADRWLSSLAGRPGIVGLALHVDYWDYIGWKDPYAKREFSVRQRKLTQLQQLALVYTPQVLLQGRDFRGWGTSAFDEAVARIHDQPAKAHIALEARKAEQGSVEVLVRAELVEADRAAHAALYLAAYESRLSSRVTAGENRGRTLLHDHVVLEWQGPFDLAGGEQLTRRRNLPLLPGAAAGNSGIAAFIQDRKTGEILQAVVLPACFS